MEGSATGTFPERLGRLVISGFHGREARNCNIIMGSGKELQTFDQPHGFALKQAIKSQSYDFDEELSFPQNTNTNLRPIVLHACNNDEKRSDLEYELSRKEINLEKLQRVINSGIPDGGSLQATTWKKFDLLRTHPDLEFFSGDSPLSRKDRESMRNILLLFAKLNPAIGYVQGMDEILAPLYYIFSTDSDEHNAANLEADTFSCFVIIMSSCVDHFRQQLDSSSPVIRSTLSNLSELLKTNDEELWHHLEYKTMMNLFLKHSQKSPAFNLLVNLQFYAFRWITLQLTQEFSLHHVLRIWDTLLSNPFGLQEMLLRICCAMLMCVKGKLLTGDFVDNLKLLQQFPEIDVEHILQVAQGMTLDTSFHSIV